MEETELFAFYGSLRRGMDNYKDFKAALEFVGITRISGYDLYSLGTYPYALRSDDKTSTLVIEIFKVKSPVARLAIHEMEVEAGYIFELIDIEDKKVGIYLFERPGDDPRVENGDWVSFYGK
ncbi:MAG TPA: gamma-glutamylcyclotransferase family protein [Cyclobacteriaceae bacterium]